MTKFVHMAAFGDRLLPFVRSSALRRDDDGELAPAVDAFADQRAHFVQAELSFGNQDAVRAAGHAGIRGDPTGIPPHDFNDHDALVGFCGCV